MIKNCTSPKTYIKDVQATGEAFSTQKRKSSTSKLKISSRFSIYVGEFCPLDRDLHSNEDPDLADQNQRGSMRIRIRNTGGAEFKVIIVSCLDTNTI